MLRATVKSDFETLLDLVSSPTVLTDRRGGVVAANAAAHETFGSLGIDCHLPFPDAARAGFERYLDRCLTTATSIPGSLFLWHVDGRLERHPCRGVRAQFSAFGEKPLVLLQFDGIAFDRRFKALAAKLHDARRVMRERRLQAQRLQSLMEERECLLGQLKRDAAARAEAEGERDAVLAQLYRAGQDERRRLARDLHDHAGQHLMALKLQLRRLQSHLTTLEGRGELARLLNQAQAVGDALRRVTLALRPAALEEFGFVTALRYLVEEWGRVTGCPVEFQVGNVEVELPPDHAITLFRLVQEALTNVAKHAGQPSAVSVVLIFGESHLTLSVEDDGNGFEAGEASVHALVAQGKLGLVGMRERISLVGGTLDIDSTPGTGTSVTARVRLERDTPSDG
ncbi:sensor histidine kinase [Methylobacterium aerolatum]|uniref:histidine kinase n=1 Tax=Methylobacterium aerolatum TaxID=418708 RepID=A0ABU0I6M9_9HYPH|nr:sensor histidine kinase [Methylobacterium aerolatum]MDQ0449698.1 signal transduction histidine kinase [Methylobacterium aerolatum]GJD37195.1 hypothetical protein FMGBMHLM_4122 [Methylobacterium aerolatum]